MGSRGIFRGSPLNSSKKMGLFGKKSQKEPKSAEIDNLNILNRLNKVELALERVDQAFINKLINRCTDLSSDVQEIRNDLKLLDECTSKFMARERARAGLKKGPAAAEEKPEEETDKEMLERLIEKGMAVPLDEKPAKNGKKTRMHKKGSRFRRKMRVRAG